MIIEQDKIGVIVPVYNVEKYLNRCIDSILAQTYTNYEIILVDDGSTDKSGVICDEYAAKDERIIVIHQKNGGVSAARNTALDWFFNNSAGQWIFFVDSDDYIRPQMLEHLYIAVKKYGVLISMSDHQNFENEQELNKFFADEIDIQIIESREWCKAMYKTSYNYKYCDVRIIGGMTMWGKLYQRSLFFEFRFPVGKIHEDQDILPKLMYTAGQIAVLPVPYYCYFTNNAGSIMNAEFSVKRFDDVDGINSCISFFESQKDAELVQVATELRDRLRNKYLLKAWKRGLWREIPKEHRPTFGKWCKILIKGIYTKLLKGYV